MFFLSAIVGGLILLVNMGPGTLHSHLCTGLSHAVRLFTGGLSVDEKKKTF